MSVDQVPASIGLEVPVDSVAGAKAAIKGGASRLELCSNLSAGGLTPSAGFIEFAARQTIPSMVLIRPRAGNFVYSGDEIALMERDISLAMTSSLTGVVVGAATDKGALDTAALRRLKRAAGEGIVCLHRVFDLTPDPFEALEQAVEIGFSRILTSGQQLSAREGAQLLAKLINKAAGRIEILPAGSITAQNVGQLLSATNVKELHASCRSPLPNEGGKFKAFGFSQTGERLSTDPDEVGALVKLLKDHCARQSRASPDY